jgi:hypothetical protein
LASASSIRSRPLSAHGATTVSSRLSLPWEPAGVTEQPTDRGDSQSVGATLLEATEQLRGALPEEIVIAETMLDKGCHGNAVLAEPGVRS